jgi:hypothetical protein
MASLKSKDLWNDPEYIEKTKLANGKRRGVKHSEETCKKRSESIKRWWAKRKLENIL